MEPQMLQPQFMIAGCTEDGNDRAGPVGSACIAWAVMSQLLS